jgi:hypothetical protein
MKKRAGPVSLWCMMVRTNFPLAVVEALKGAGATEEMIAAAVGAFGAWEDVPRAKAAARQRAYRSRQRNVTRDKAPPVTHVPSLKGRLVDAARWNVDRLADSRSSP